MPTVSSHPSRASGIPLIIFTLLSWASIPLFLKYFVSSIDAWTANGWRYGISALFWLPLLAVARFRGRVPNRLLIAAIVPALFNTAGQTCFAWCPYFLDPGFFTFVFRVQIIFVTLGAYIFIPSERAILHTPRFWLGMLGVVAGSVGLIFFSEHGLAAPEKLFAIFLAITSGALFAGYALSVRHFMHSYPAVLAFGVICQYTAVAALVLMLVLGRDHGSAVLGFSPFQWFMLFASSMIGIAISHVLYYAALTRLGVAVSMGIVQLQPIFTAAASMFLFNERLGALQWAAGLVGVCGAILILSVRPPHTPAPDKPHEALADEDEATIEGAEVGA